MDYLKLFQTHSEYEGFVSGDTMVKPNVSHCIQENEVHYNHIPKPDEQYLTFEILSGGTLTWSKYNGTSYARTIYYSTDNGNQWNEMNNYSSNVSINVNAGDKLIFKGNNNCYGAYSDYEYFSRFGGTSRFNIYGNIMSLIYGDNFYEKQYEYPEDIGLYKGLFFGLFSNANVISAKNLILPLLELHGDHDYGWMFIGCSLLIEPPKLPATTLADNCYRQMFDSCTAMATAPELPATTLTECCYEGMFYGCTSLTTAPELPATTLVSSCYGSMFSGCTSLTSITCLATNIPGTSCTYAWMRGVAASGTFTKAADMAGWSTGANGIPTGWTVQDAS